MMGQTKVELKQIVNGIKEYTRSQLVWTTSLEKLQGNLDDLSISPPEQIETPEVTGMSFYEPAKHLRRDIYTTPSIYSVILPGIIYYPKTEILLTRSRKVISDSSSTIETKESFVNSVNLKKIYFSNTEKIKGFCTVFRTFANGSNYYHTLIDNLPRLYLLHQDSYQKLSEIKVLCNSQPTPVESFFLKRLLPENAVITIVDSNQVYSIESFIFLNYLSRRFAGFLPSEYLNWFMKRVGPERPRERKNRIFISRAKKSEHASRCILNEDELFSMLEKHGFQKYNLETMAIEDQIDLFYDAEFVVGTHGAGLTNLIFSNQINVLELHTMKNILPHYYYLSKSLGHHYNYWSAQELDRDSNFEVSTAELEEIIKSSSSK
ncbi:MAG: glycosyltransferase family 61 protein [Microcoleaceae cyanobacterium]